MISTSLIYRNKVTNKKFTAEPFWGPMITNEVVYEPINNKDYVIENNDFKIYKNDEAGVEIKFPSTYTLEGVGAPQDPQHPYIGNVIISTPQKVHLIEIVLYRASDFNETANKIFVGPYPKITGPSEYAGPKTYDKRTIANISGVEVYGYSGEFSQGYTDTFYFKNNNIVGSMTLQPYAEGRISKQVASEFDSYTEFNKPEDSYTNFNIQEYIKIRDSLKVTNPSS